MKRRPDDLSGHSTIVGLLAFIFFFFFFLFFPLPYFNSFREGDGFTLYLRRTSHLVWVLGRIEVRITKLGGKD